MQNQFSRTQRLVGEENIRRFSQARVAVFGVGGVGGYVVEALARSGIGTLDLIDDDRVSLTNLNRQIIALHSTIGMYKVDAAKQRILDINPGCVVNTWKMFYLPETAVQFDFSQYDYVVDAIDTVTGKLMLAEQANAAGTPIISCMGAGNKLDPGAFEVADIYQTSVCPLAKVMRRELKKRGIPHLKVVYSKEEALTPAEDPEEEPGMDDSSITGGTPENQFFSETEGSSTEKKEHRRRAVPGSVAFVPAAAGLIIAGEVIRDLMSDRKQTEGQ